jgi:hypothetical protein
VIGASLTYTTEVGNLFETHVLNFLNDDLTTIGESASGSIEFIRIFEGLLLDGSNLTTTTGGCEFYNCEVCGVTIWLRTFS